MPISDIDTQAFRDNPCIKELAPHASWTISDLSKGKMPVDIKYLKYFNKVVGATEPIRDNITGLDYNPLVTLDEIPFYTNNIPLNNVAYKLNGLECNYVCLDIEKECPEELKQELLKLPYVYGEYSISGKGYHLMFPYPKDTSNKTRCIVVLKRKDRAYEILMNHYCTFTRRPLTPINNSINNPNPDAFDKLFNQMLSDYQKKHTAKQHINIEKECDLSQIPMLRSFQDRFDKVSYKKTPQDFLKADGITPDMSSYEFGYMNFAYNQIQTILDTLQKYLDIDLTDTQTAHLIYWACLNYLDERSKWYETRDGLPWMLWQAKNVVAMRKTRDESDK